MHTFFSYSRRVAGSSLDNLLVGGRQRKVGSCSGSGSDEGVGETSRGFERRFAKETQSERSLLVSESLLCRTFCSGRSRFASLTRANSTLPLFSAARFFCEDWLETIPIRSLSDAPLEKRSTLRVEKPLEKKVNILSFCQFRKMALPGKGKKRTTTQKTSALSKRHKAAVKPETSTKTKSFKETPAVEKVPRAKTAFPVDKASKEKKDRKGKGPLFIPAVEQDSTDDDSDGAMELDEEIDGEQGDFLMALDEKGMAVYGLIPPNLAPLKLILSFFEMQFSPVSRCELSEGQASTSLTEGSQLDQGLAPAACAIEV